MGIKGSICATQEQTYNPYRVSVGNTVEMATCDETMGSYYHKRYVNNNFPFNDQLLYVYRCAVGDLSGKNGQVDIRAQGSLMRTQVATDSNLPLVGPYTGNPFYLVTITVLILYLTTLVLKYYCQCTFYSSGTVPYSVFKY